MCNTCLLVGKNWLADGDHPEEKKSSDDDHLSEHCCSQAESPVRMDRCFLFHVLCTKYYNTSIKNVIDKI